MKGIFTYNSDVNKTAYLNWRTDKHDALGNMISLADGYFKAAITLSENLLNDNRNKDADVIIFPMLFSVNHGIELYLKVLIWEYNILLKNDMKFDKIHDIKQLYNVVEKRMIAFEGDKDQRKKFRQLTLGLKKYIDELYENIELREKSNDNMDFSRYPFNRSFENHFYADDYMNKVVDLENFLIRFKEIGENLDSITSHYLYDYIQSDY
ncbi:hypothetical protein EZV73_15235 [Acidaminobacter sp. JC074]|uniref:hypothetical protein n=1 Tax=Acidaminobacter sp. JC074 TaxID=2530199 RepID=UPI001F0DC155|nr:hypothetical protein [Acidaminobacter sp. JC074]MCH4888946.1 hypothetical protein [Acidaminobacter sp. JC074]